MPSVPVQVRLDRELHVKVAKAAETLHTSRNAMYQLLIELGLNSLSNLERAQFPSVTVTADQIKYSPANLVTALAERTRLVGTRAATAAS